MITLPSSKGGSVLAFAARIALARDNVVLWERYTSAATMWLGYRNVYVERHAKFGFHRIKRDFTGLAERIYRRHLRAAHPDLEEWFMKNASKSDRLVFLSGDDLIKRGWAKEWKF